MSVTMWLALETLVVGVVLIALLLGVAFLARPPRRTPGDKSRLTDTIRLVFVVLILALAGLVLLGTLSSVVRDVFAGTIPTTAVADSTENRP